MERRSGKRSSSAGSERMERVGDRQGKMERYCSTGQNPQRAVAPTEEEEESSCYEFKYPSTMSLHMNIESTQFLSFSENNPTVHA